MTARGAHLLLAALLGCGGSPASDAAPPPSDAPVDARPRIPPPEPDVACTPGPGSQLELLPIVTEGLLRPLLATAPDWDARLFVVEQAGRIRIIRDGALVDTPFLAIEDLVLDGGERGLLGLAFHPDFIDNGRLFVDYTREPDGATVIAEYRVMAEDPDRADPESARELLVIPQPFANHNGGMLEFGPDGWMYIAMGDGGDSGDPFGNAQNLEVLLGKLLRLDVDAPAPEPEIWAYGLRNPWRFAFDRQTGDLYIADVGQRYWEEIDVQPAGGGPGVNYGWDIIEGNHCFLATSCDTTGMEPPIYEYMHVDGGACSITGGFVYRGSCIPDLAGQYFFADYCTNEVFTLAWPDAITPVDRSPELDSTNLIDGLASFGRSATGELYVLSIRTGDVFKIIRAGTAP